MIIETERLILRPFEERDRSHFLATHSDPHTMRYYPSTWDVARCDSVITAANEGLKHFGFGWLSAELKLTGTYVGTIGVATLNEMMISVIPATSAIEIGWRFSSSVWGQGLAPEGAAACLDYVWENLEFSEVFAFTFDQNRPSMRVMEKIGMHRVLDGDFAHPNLPADDRVSPHVLYRVEKPLA